MTGEGMAGVSVSAFLGVKLRMEYEKIVFDKVIDLVLDVFLIN